MTGWIGDFAEANPWPATAAALVVGLVLLALMAIVAKAVVKAFKARRYGQGRLTAAQMVTTFAALLATGVGANTAWRFAGTKLHITNEWERAGLFLVGEVMLFGLALMARQNLHNKQLGRTGLPGTLVWVLSGFLAVPAIAESKSFGEAAWRIVLGPLGAAMLWHLAMGIELRQSKEDALNNGVAARILRRFQQQLLSRLGIAEHDKDAEELIQERARSQAAELTDRYLGMTEKQLEGRRGRRLRSKLRATLRRADVAGNPERKRLLLADLAVSAHAPALVKLEHESPWIEKPVLAAVPAVPEVTVGSGEEERAYEMFRAFISQTGTFPTWQQLRELETGHPLPASDVDAELQRMVEQETEDGDGPDDDGPKGPGGAPAPAQAEPVLTVEEQEHALHRAALAPLSNADAVRYAIGQTGSAVAGELVRWLANHGKQDVNAGQAYRVAKKHFEDQRRSNIRPLRPTSGD